MIHDVLHHIICGWQGFVRVLVKATDAGVKFTPDDLNMLASMRAEIEEVLAKQTRL